MKTSEIKPMLCFDFKPQVFSHSRLLIKVQDHHLMLYSIFFGQDPCFITNQTDYEPYDKLKELSGAIMWPQDVKGMEESSDDGAMLGYVSITLMFV